LSYSIHCRCDFAIPLNSCHSLTPVRSAVSGYEITVEVGFFSAAAAIDRSVVAAGLAAAVAHAGTDRTVASAAVGLAALPLGADRAPVPVEAGFAADRAGAGLFVVADHLIAAAVAFALPAGAEFRRVAAAAGFAVARAGAGRSVPAVGAVPDFAGIGNSPDERSLN
jgi:hypothetical protein